MKKVTAIFAIFCFIVCSAKAQTIDSSSYYLNAGKTARTERKFLSASKLFEKSISFNNKNIEAYIQNGLVNLDMKRPSIAVSFLEKALALDPKNIEVISTLSLQYYNLRKYNEAINLARKCINCENSLKIIGMSQYALQDYTSAEKTLLPLAASTNDAEIIYSLGKAYLNREEFDKAISYYEKAIILEPAKSLWLYELANIYYNKQNFESSLLCLEKAVAAGFPQSLTLKENMGFTAIEAGQYDKGEQLLEEVVKLKTGNKSIYFDVAIMLYQKGQFDRSLKYCQKMLEADSSNARALYQAGLNFQKKGQKEKGQNMCDKAIEMDPSLERLRTKKEL